MIVSNTVNGSSMHSSFKCLWEKTISTIKDFFKNCCKNSIVHEKYANNTEELKKKCSFGLLTTTIIKKLNCGQISDLT